MSGFPLTLGRSRKPARRRPRKAVPPEYNMLLTATLGLLALGAVMVCSASSTTRILQNGGLADSAFYLKRTLRCGAVGLTTASTCHSTSAKRVPTWRTVASAPARRSGPASRPTAWRGRAPR